MAPKWNAKAKANYKSLGALAKAVNAPAAPIPKIMLPNPKGKALPAQIQGAKDGYLRAAASASDTSVLPLLRLPQEVVPTTGLNFAPFRGATWDNAPDVNSVLGLRGANNWSQIEITVLLGAVAAYECEEMAPWTFVMLVILFDQPGQGRFGG